MHKIALSDQLFGYGGFVSERKMSIHTAMIKENLDQREGQPEPNSAGVTGGGSVLDVTPCSLSLGEGTGMESDGAWNQYAGCDHPEFEQRIHEHGTKMELERDQLRHAVRRVRDAKGLFHTQKAFEHLLLLLPENVDVEGPADNATPQHLKGN